MLHDNTFEFCVFCQTLHCCTYILRPSWEHFTVIDSIVIFWEINPPKISLLTNLCIRQIQINIMGLVWHRVNKVIRVCFCYVKSVYSDNNMIKTHCSNIAVLFLLNWLKNKWLFEWLSLAFDIMSSPNLRKRDMAQKRCTFSKLPMQF